MRAFRSLAVSVPVALALGGAAVAGPRLRVTGDAVSLRPVADINSEVLGSVDRGQVLEAVEWPSDGEWVMVRPPRELTFWVYASLVSDGTVDRTQVKVRGGPSVNYKPVATLTKGDKVTVVGKSGDWLEITPPGSAVVWINGKFVEPADGSRAATPAPQPPAPQPVADVRAQETVLPPPPPPPEEIPAPPPPTLQAVAEPVPVSVPAPVATQPAVEWSAPPAAAIKPAPARIEPAPSATMAPPPPRMETAAPFEMPSQAETPAIASMPSSRPDSNPAVSLVSQPRETPSRNTAAVPANTSRPSPAAQRPTPSASHAGTTPRRQPASSTSAATVAAATAPASAAASAPAPAATTRRRYRAATPRSYPQQQAPTRVQSVVAPAPGSTRVDYSGELARGGRLTITNRGEYRLITPDSRGPATTLCFLSGSPQQFESLLGETVKVEGYQTWNTGARHPTVVVDSIVRIASPGRER